MLPDDRPLSKLATAGLVALGLSVAGFVGAILCLLAAFGGGGENVAALAFLGAGLSALVLLAAFVLSAIAFVRIVVKGEKSGGFMAGVTAALSGTGIGLLFTAWNEVSNLNFNKGRKLRIGERPRVAPAIRGDGWAAGEPPDHSQLTSVERMAIGQTWLRAAELEHASIPAFAELSTRLIALGAPPELIERSHRAALDEIDHARRCYAIANGYLGVSRTAGPLPALLEPRPPSRHDDSPFVRLAVGSLIDGCLGEGLSAAMARTSAERVRDPVLRHTLEIIARDEAAHAELGWDVLLWCIEAGGNDVAAAVHRAAAALDEQPAPALRLPPGLSAERMSVHGYLPPEDLRALHDARIEETRERVWKLLARPALPQAA